MDALFCNRRRKWLEHRFLDVESVAKTSRQSILRWHEFLLVIFFPLQCNFAPPPPHGLKGSLQFLAINISCFRLKAILLRLLILSIQVNRACAFLTTSPHYVRDARNNNARANPNQPSFFPFILLLFLILFFCFFLVFILSVISSPDDFYGDKTISRKKE